MQNKKNETFEESLFSQCIVCDYFVVAMNPICKITKKACYDLNFKDCPLVVEAVYDVE